MTIKTPNFNKYRRILPSISGNFLIAEENGRSEIMIHGGAPAPNSSAIWYPLRPTYGCVRLSNSDQKELIQVLEQNESYGKIKISEI